MPTWIADIDKRRIGTTSVVTSESDWPASFPVDLWGIQSDRYAKYWSQFTGQIWEETIPNSADENGIPQLRYPLQINYLKEICMKHSYVLFGEVPDGPQPLVPIRCVPAKDLSTGNEDPDTDQNMKFAKQIQNFVNKVWMENDGRNLQQEGGLVQQFLGGHIFKVGWSPYDSTLRYGIRIENVIPDFFLPVWDGGRPNHLLEAWIVYRIPTREAALRFDFPIEDGMQDPMYVEHWTEKSITITLNNKPITYTVDDVQITYDNFPNPFGFVPFVYIPRERAGGYYGLSLLDDLVGIAKELNARIADMGDVVEETAHRDVFFNNLSGAPKTTDYGGTRPAINLGTSPPGVNDQPNAWAIDPLTVTESIAGYPEFLRKQLGRDSSIPDVAYGEDEGSQRSALTLAFRMWPLTAKIRAVRTYWTTGLILLAKMIVKIAMVKSDVYEMPDFIKSMDLDSIDEIDWSVDWSPMIPRDKEQELNEIVVGIQSQMLSPVTGLSLLNLVDDPAVEYKRVQDHMIFNTQLQASLKASGTSDSSSTSGASTPKPPQIVTQSPVVETVMSEPKG